MSSDRLTGPHHLPPPAPPPGGHRIRPRGLAAGLAAVLALAGGCSLPRDDEPQAIPTQALPAALFEPAGTSTTVGPAARSELATLFFLRSDSPEADDELAPSPRTVAVPGDTAEYPRAVIEQLFEGPTKDQLDADAVRTAIPDSAQLLDVDLDGDTLVVNLANLGTVEGTLQRLALAQLVFTATQAPPSPDLPLVRSVRVLQRGQPVTLQVEGQMNNPDEAITRDDFPTLQRQLNDPPDDGQVVVPEPTPEPTPEPPPGP